MSFRSVVSFKWTRKVQCSEKSLISSGGPLTADSEQKEETGVIEMSPILKGVTATPPGSDETLSANDQSTAEAVSQDPENNERKLGNGSIDTEILNTQLTRSEPRRASSFAIPDGLAMDPMTPTALAVSSEFMDRIGSGLTLLRGHGKKLQKYVMRNRRFDSFKKSWKSIVNVMLVEAKDLPDGPASGTNCVYCKFRVGAETHKSKQVPKSKATWCERFNIYCNDYDCLEVTVWHKGKQKNFMGRCLIDLSQLEKEKTHDLWQELECGYGTLHLLVTLSATVRYLPVDNVPTTNGVRHMIPVEQDFSWYRLDTGWSEVGQLSVTVHGARGLTALGISGKADAYCVLELDNSRVQTHTVHGTSEPNWNKSYSFGVNDITSTLDITVYDDSIINPIKEVLGKISIPLLRINNDEKRWYALKDRTKRTSARGNCPRILLQMSIVWNPIKASLRVLSPKENKYIQKPPKFDIPLIYNNILFIRNLFDIICLGNEYFKSLFEWENREKSAVALIAWLAFWYFFRPWMTPLLVLAPFIYNWSGYRSCNHLANVPVFTTDDDMSEEDEETRKDDKTIKTRLYSLQELTFAIKGYIDYIVACFEKLINLSNFTVPYLSYLAMIVLVMAAAALYFIPTGYIFMALGIYKFTRKLVNPERVPNNDILDFLSRVPDNKTLKQWKELKVPEPNVSVSRVGSIRRR